MFELPKIDTRLGIVNFLYSTNHDIISLYTVLNLTKQEIDIEIEKRSIELEAEYLNLKKLRPAVTDDDVAVRKNKEQSAENYAALIKFETKELQEVVKLIKLILDKIKSKISESKALQWLADQYLGDRLYAELSYSNHSLFHRLLNDFFEKHYPQFEIDFEDIPDRTLSIEEAFDMLRNNNLLLGDMK